MKKFKYIAPKSQVIEIELSSIMATSTEAIKKFKEEDYTEETVKNFWETPSDKDIWAD